MRVPSFTSGAGVLAGTGEAYPDRPPDAERELEWRWPGPAVPAAPILTPYHRSKTDPLS